MHIEALSLSLSNLDTIGPDFSVLIVRYTNGTDNSVLIMEMCPDRDLSR